MGRKTNVKCKVHKGVRICTVSTPRGRHLSFSSPVSAMPPVTMKLFTSEDCSFCGIAEKKLKNITKGMEGIINVQKIDVETDAFMKEDLPNPDDFLLPSIQIGNNLITGEFDEDSIWRGIFDAYQMT